MLLRPQGPRGLSPIEQKAVELVFKGTINPRDISLTVVENIEEWVKNEPWDIKPVPVNPLAESIVGQEGGAGKPHVNWPPIKNPLRVGSEREPSNLLRVQVASTYDGDGKIRINRSAFPFTGLDKDSDLTSKERDPSGLGELKDPFRPANMHYLSTLIHECTHHWQEVYGRHRKPSPNVSPSYRFNGQQLLQRDVPELSAEQHASAVQVYFLIDWQLEHQPKGSDVNLTSRSKNSRDNVGPVDRFRNIDTSIHNVGTGASRIFKYQRAREAIHNYFGWLLVELRYGWKAVCQGKEPFSKVTGG